MGKEAIRWIAAHIKRPLFPVEISGYLNEFDRFEAALASGMGGIIVINHFSKGDFPHLASSIIFDRPALRNRRFLIPIAYHQYEEARGPAALFGVELAPLVTGDTVEYFEKHKETTGKKERKIIQGIERVIANRRAGFLTYLRTAKEVLEQGGIVALSPQAGRRPGLKNTSSNRPIEILLKNTNNNVILLPIGIGLKGVEDYSFVTEYNLSKKYQMNVGRVFTKEELMFAASGDESVDQLVIDLLRQVVPESYLK